MVLKDFLEVSCPVCGAKHPDVLREGTRKTSAGIVQKFYCGKCGRYFSERAFPGTKHPPWLIFSAISLYNQGHTLEGVARQLRKKHKADVRETVIHSWIRKYSEVCSFSKLRGNYRLVPEKLIFTKRFDHEQVYFYKVHTLKANIMGKACPQMRDFLFGIFKNLDDKPFRSGQRCSETVVFRPVTARELPKSTAPLLCRMGLETARRRRNRHGAVEHFFLANDLATVAVEIPVHARGYEIKKVIRWWKYGDLHGHIDLLQYRKGQLVVMDYKPAPFDEAQAQNQLSLYAILLSIRTGIPLKNFKCGYFNEKTHKEFYPA